MGLKMCINRKEFRKIFNNIHPGLGDEKSALWVSESLYRPSRWFVKVKPIEKDAGEMSDYRLWCHQHCSGQILCYYSDPENKEEWWGFTHRPDVFLWLLKWA